MIFLVTYDLKQPDRDYTSLFEAIKQCSSAWWHYLESVWIIDTTLDLSSCYDIIKPSMDENDYLFIIQLTSKNYQGWLPSKAWDWLKQHKPE